MEDKGARRAIATFISIVVIVVIMAIYGCARDESEAIETLYQGVPLDKHLLEVDRRALEDAYRDHLKLLFSVWLKDDVSVVHRINTGLRRAREAYGQAAAKIEERERALGGAR